MCQTLIAHSKSGQSYSKVGQILQILVKFGFYGGLLHSMRAKLQGLVPL